MIGRRDGRNRGSQDTFWRPEHSRGMCEMPRNVAVYSRWELSKWQTFHYFHLEPCGRCTKDVFFMWIQNDTSSPSIRHWFGDYEPNSRCNLKPLLLQSGPPTCKLVYVISWNCIWENCIYIYIHTYIHTYHNIPYHTISYHIISYHITPCHFISYHIISYHIISIINPSCTTCCAYFGAL